jgi:hypothetical protein
MEARRSAGLSTAPPCLWSPSPPLELKGAPAHALDANSGFVSFVIFPRHVEPDKLERIVWNLSTFYAYVSYHIKTHTPGGTTWSESYLCCKRSCIFLYLPQAGNVQPHVIVDACEAADCGSNLDCN